jgi:hypothetical protein
MECVVIMNEKLTWSMYKESCNIYARGLPLNEIEMQGENTFCERTLDEQKMRRNLRRLA